MKWAILIALLLGIGSVRAEPIDETGGYPTVTALAEAIIPARDRVDLAMRLRGLRRYLTRR